MKKMSLSPEHIARVHRVVQDEGLAPGAQLHTDEDYDAWVDRIMRSHPEPDASTRLFAYGSLIWKPEIEHTDEEIGNARGWHRSFCFRMPRFRGTNGQPGLMMALDRGGQCKGMLYTLPAKDIGAQFGKLFRREFTFKPANSMPQWITVSTAKGVVPALTFVMNRESPLYAGRLAPGEVAEILAKACGHWGTGAEYLLNTVTSLENKGIHDSNLWRLQRLVAERIEATAS